MARPLRHVPPDSVVEVTARTAGSRILLRPGPTTNDLIVGVLGRAQALYGIRIYAVAVMSPREEVPERGGGNCKRVRPGAGRERRCQRLRNCKRVRPPRERRCQRLRNWGDEVPETSQLGTSAADKAARWRDRCDMCLLIRLSKSRLGRRGAGSC